MTKVLHDACVSAWRVRVICIHHMKANGKLAPKVFKLAKKRLAARQTLHLSKQHSFRAINTRAYYPGRHMLEVQINGTIYVRQAFYLR